MIKEELKQEAEKFARTEMSHPNEYGLYYCTFLKVAEPREKRIAELERKLEQTEKDLVDYQFNYPTIKELEQENAELKARLNAINLLTPELQKLSKAKTQQLTKANKHIKRLIEAIRMGDCYNLAKAEIEAEQFLNEV